MDRNFVVVDADLSPERRLQGTRGQGLQTYKELIRNMSTRTRPEGGALTPYPRSLDKQRAERGDGFPRLRLRRPEACARDGAEDKGRCGRAEPKWCTASTSQSC